MKKYFFSMLTLVFLSACDSAQNVDHKIRVLNEEMAEAMLNYQSAYARKRTTILFQNDTTASTCAEYIQASRESTIKEDLSNQLIKSEYLECDVLALFGDKPFSTQIDGPAIGESLASRLDLRSFSSSIVQRLEDDQFTLSQLDDGRMLKITPTSAILETDDWLYKISVIVVADLDQNNRQDWLLWLVDEAKQGNYRNYQSLIVYNPLSSHNRLLATPFPVEQAGE